MSPDGRDAPSCTLVSLNLRRGAPGRHWPALAELLQEVEPDIVCLQEANGWGDDLIRLCAAEADLGMRGVLAPSGSGFHTALLYRPGRARLVRWETRYAQQTLHGFGIGVLELPGIETPLAVVSAHLTPYSAAAAAQEAQVIASRLRRASPLGVLAGDVNYPGLGDPTPDWSRVPDHDRVARCLPRDSDTVPWRANPLVGATLRTAGLCDVAAHLADSTGDATLRAPTSRGGMRVDQVHITRGAQATGYRLLDTAEHSDHQGLVVNLDLSPRPESATSTR
ncbi:endonuclease/exonuclease/phosphatase family protein [Frankia gtarii]|uniref:endonuclease/exonuclease/phosphatase family protein n=1 Tax=Frankia gtarii TaxID=2950102 RepID=UPI0021C0480E|nr:endonuclease/exonuclease/phosphatase family protein [Frankia gtarii]